MNDNITDKTLADGGNIAPADGVAAVSNTEEVVEVKDLLKTVLNKDYPTNEAAIQSLKDTFSYVGSMGQKVNTLENTIKELESQKGTPELAATVATLQKQVNEANFFASNAQYNTPEARALISRFGGNPADVVNDEVFKTAFTAITKTSAQDASQSILHTNPKLGIAQDSMTKAVEAQKAGNQVQAAANAVDAVIGAYGMV
jgi:hypothetical protein